MSDSGVQPTLPPLREQINNAKQAARRVITKAAHGDPVTVSSEESEARLSICRQCEVYRDSDGRCSKCGCFIRFKARLATEKCPIDKWQQGPVEAEPGQPVILDGNMVLENELELREVLPPDCQLVQLLNQYQVAQNSRGGCRSCRRKRFVRNAQGALIEFLNEATPEQKLQVRDVFPGTTHVAAGGKAVHWSRFGVSS